MTILLTIVHIIVCVFLVIVVLLQSGKAADLAGAFGGMGSQTAFGPRGAATVLSKATTIAAALFMLTSLSLAILATRGSGGTKSVLDQQPATSKSAPAQKSPTQQPAQPGQAVPSGAPLQATPGQGTPAPGQPYMELTPEGGGPSKKVPLDIKPAPTQTAPAKPAPAPAK